MARRAPLTAKARALNLLSRREHGRVELERKLRAKGHERQEIAQALDRLEELELLDDRRAVASLARYQALQRGHGPLKIRAALREKGFSGAHVAEALDALEVDWLEQCRLVAERRPLDPEDRRSRDRLLRFLAGRGFPSSLAHQVLDERLRAD